ncbi:hypothetical protein [Marinimicrobium locisalis]|uniref:hypothetical protein n=1 Tax=Marinimicrobium locisalis TaxID=546022 RepID=UPI0032221D2B
MVTDIPRRKPISAQRIALGDYKKLSLNGIIGNQARNIVGGRRLQILFDLARPGVNGHNPPILERKYRFSMPP